LGKKVNGRQLQPVPFPDSRALFAHKPEAVANAFAVLPDETGLFNRAWRQYMKKSQWLGTKARFFSRLCHLLADNPAAGITLCSVRPGAAVPQARGDSRPVPLYVTLDLCTEPKSQNDMNG
jgi:hypothetical protein